MILFCYNKGLDSIMAVLIYAGNSTSAYSRLALGIVQIVYSQSDLGIVQIVYSQSALGIVQIAYSKSALGIVEIVYSQSALGIVQMSSTAELGLSSISVDLESRSRV